MRLRDGSRSLLGKSGVAQAFENALKLGQVFRVTALPPPEGAGAGGGERRVERETGLDSGTRLVLPTKLRQSGRQLKMSQGEISVGFDRPSKTRDRFLPKTEVALRCARGRHPGVGGRIARTEAQGLANVTLCFFGPTDKNASFEIRVGSG